jgi:hypothetical protein
MSTLLSPLQSNIPANFASPLSKTNILQNNRDYAKHWHIWAHHRQIHLKINIYSLWNNSIRIARSDQIHVSAFADDLSGILYKNELQHEYL